jgi:hypothetical protein
MKGGKELMIALRALSFKVADLRTAALVVFRA